MTRHLLTRGPITIDHQPGRGPLVIAFSSIGHDPARPPEREFTRTAAAQGRPALFVRDASRSWASAPEFDTALRAALGLLPPPPRIVALGLSMGGFCALSAARVLPVDAVLALGPQFRPNGDPRWRHWTALLPPLACPVPDGPWITLMHGLADDRAQAMAFPQRPGLDHLLFDGIAHAALGPHLKTHGLQGLVDALATGDRRRLLRIASAAGGRRRQLPR